MELQKHGPYLLGSTIPRVLLVSWEAVNFSGPTRTPNCMPYSLDAHLVFTSGTHLAVSRVLACLYLRLFLPLFPPSLLHRLHIQLKCSTRKPDLPYHESALYLERQSRASIFRSSHVRSWMSSGKDAPQIKATTPQSPLLFSFSSVRTWSE